MTKIWNTKKGVKTNQVVENYTVGVDYLLDLELMPYDILGTKAQAKMLHKIKILSDQELRTAIRGLNELQKLWQAGKFKIEKEQEDGHTAIEAYLTANYGEVGKKIHAGRSRNDQSMTMTRLFMKDHLSQVKGNVNGIIKELEKQIKRYGKIKMPGYTHMQRAMPATVGMWLGSYASGLRDDLILVEAALKVIDQNPLGSAAGYGENVLGLDRKLTARELGFARVQENPMYCAYSRGKFEGLVLGAISSIMFDLGKIASDLLLFTTKEFDFFTLPDEFRTGSSIMPQKKNYDVLELVRGNIAVFMGYKDQIDGVVRNLPVGYNRDFQLTKEPFMKGMKLAAETMEVMTLVIKNLGVKKENLERACTPELYATDEALKLVKGGKSFREAYQEVKEKFS